MGKENEPKTKFTPGVSIPINRPLDDRNNVDKQPRPFSDLPEDVQALLLGKKKKEEKKTALEVLSEKHVMECLLYIENMQPVLKSDIYNNITRSDGMVRKLNDLRELGLIEIYETARFNSNVIILTSKGRSTAEAIRHMIGIVQGDLEPYY